MLTFVAPMKLTVCTLLSVLFLCTLSVPLSAQQPSTKDQVYIVPFSHLDLFWAGTREETLSRGNRIISRAMQLAEEHPEFRFLLEDDVFVENFMDSRRGTPETERLLRLVKSGQIEIAPKWAGTYQNLARGEALVRNFIYGKQYAREVFGVDPQVAHLGDIPGFTRQYPQILSKSNVPFTVMTRMAPKDIPLFRWKAPDGSSAIAWNAVKGYGWGVGLGLHRDDMDAARLERISKEVGAVQTLTRGPVYVGWGTDLFAPNERLVSNLGILNTDKALASYSFLFATPIEFFRAAEKTPDLPVLMGEIQGSWANINSSASLVWPPTIAAVDTLASAEKFATISYALGYSPYPQDRFDVLWKKTLEAMDHNFYGQGGLLGDARKIEYANAAISEGGQIMRDSLRNIAERVQHPKEEATAIVVFNPLAWTRDDVVRAHVSLYGDVVPSAIPEYRKAMKLVDAEGNSIPFDVESYTENMSRAMMLVFTAQKVPSLGYKTYYLEPAAEAAAPDPGAQVTLDEEKNKYPFRIEGSDVFENNFYRMVVDRRLGRVTIFDKQLNREIVHDMEISGAETLGGDAISVFPYTGRTIYNEVDSVKLVDNGSAETVVRISGSVAGEPVQQQLTMYRDLPRIDIENTVNWTPGRYMELQQVFPMDLAGAEVRNGVPYGSASTDEIMPGAGPHQIDEIKPELWKTWRQIQRWITASTADSSVTISADHQIFTVDDHSIRGDMLRGTSYNQLRTFTLGKPVPILHPLAGTYVYRYSITSGKGNWAATRAWQAGENFNTPLVPVIAENELLSATENLPAEQSFLSITGDNLVVSALKKAQKGDGIVVRVYDEAGRATGTSVKFLGQERSFQAVNLLEEATGTDSKTSLQVTPFSIETILMPAPARK